MIQIRKADSADAGSLSELNAAFNAVNRTAEVMRRALRDCEPSETVLVAEEAGSILGFACFQVIRSVCYDQPWAEITELYVRPSHRRVGVGFELVSAAITGAKDLGASEVLLRVNARNEAAKGLYAKAGLSGTQDTVYSLRLDDSN
jgi:ribosomal protein S18 acetylase RimI-like enzyme